MRTKIMQARKGYSEQVGPDEIDWGQVYCLPNQTLLLCEINHFFTWNDKDKKFVEVQIPILNFPIDGYSSNEITKVQNSFSMFLYNHISVDPDHYNSETVTSFLLEGNKYFLE
jgi:hypothetical protein